MADTYCIELADICGVVLSRFAAGFELCLTTVRELVSAHPKLRVRVSNLDAVLTPEEQEKINAAVLEARQSVRRTEVARWLRAARTELRLGKLDYPEMLLRQVDRALPFMRADDQTRVHRIVARLKLRIHAVWMARRASLKSVESFAVGQQTMYGGRP